MNHEDAVAIHATAVVVGEAGVVIRGPSGAGKSRLALLLLAEARRRGSFARLVGDDRVLVRARGGLVIAAPHPAIAGLIERRTQPLGTLPYEAACVVRLVVDLHGPGALLPRLAADRDTVQLIEGAPLPLLRLQAPPDSLSCCFVFEALGARSGTGGGR